MIGPIDGQRIGGKCEMCDRGVDETVVHLMLET